MAGRFVRDWFTDEIEEVPSEGGGRQIIARETIPYNPRRTGDRNAWAKPLDTLTLGVHPDQVDHFNAQLDAVGITGARYLKSGRKAGALRSYDRESYAQASALRGYYNADPGDVESKYAKALGK